MSEQMDFADGKYTVIHENGKLTALRHGEPWERGLTGDNLIYWMLMDALKLKAERDALAAQLAELEGQEPMGWIYRHQETAKVQIIDAQQVESGFENNNPRWLKYVPFYARPIPTESRPVNARLVEALENCVAFIEDAHILEAQWHWEPIKQAQDAIAAAEAALAAPQPDADDWIPWAGGECPVGVNDLTEVKLRNGTAFIDDEAQEGDLWLWDHEDDPSDIIAYRVVEAQP